MQKSVEFCIGASVFITTLEDLVGCFYRLGMHVNFPIKNNGIEASTILKNQ